MASEAQPGNWFPAKNGPRSNPEYMVEESGVLLVDGDVTSNGAVWFSELACLSQGGWLVGAVV